VELAIRTEHLTKIYAGRVIAVNAFSLEEFSPISLNQAIPTLLRQPWSPPEADSQSQPAEGRWQDAAKQVSDFMKVFSEGPPARSEPKPGFFNRDEFQDFSLTRVVLGYGLPTLAAIGLATLCFCFRDL